MANIRLSELSPVGSELFEDAENFLSELGDRELNNILGGGDSAATVSAKTMVSGISGGGDDANYGNANYTKIRNFGALKIKVKLPFFSFSKLD